MALFDGNIQAEGGGQGGNQAGQQLHAAAARRQNQQQGGYQQRGEHGQPLFDAHHTRVHAQQVLAAKGAGAAGQRQQPNGKNGGSEIHGGSVVAKEKAA